MKSGVCVRCIFVCGDVDRCYTPLPFTKYKLLQRCVQQRMVHVGLIWFNYPNLTILFGASTAHTHTQGESERHIKHMHTWWMTVGVCVTVRVCVLVKDLLIGHLSRFNAGAVRSTQPRHGPGNLLQSFFDYLLLAVDTCEKPIWRKTYALHTHQVFQFNGTKHTSFEWALH